MKPITILISLLLFSFSTSHLFGQCAESTVTINISTDNFPNESSWSLLDMEGNLISSASLNGEAQFSLVTYDVCVDSNSCLSFIMSDSYGDGIFAPGGFEVLLDSMVVVSNVLFKKSYTATFNCPPGSSCNSAEQIIEGPYQTSYDDHWYIFEPDSSGQYEVTTCGLTSCDTKIWAYSNCPGTGISEDNTGTIFFDDNFGGCGEQANLSIAMQQGLVYYIRVGDDQDVCGDSIDWSINFEGAITGCTDPNSCNYNPLATIDDGSCLPNGDPGCPNAPDLILDQNVLRSSIYLDQLDNTDDCLINEGCLQGYGVRDIVRFSTRIDNIGELDYFIGLETDNAGQFTFDNCHNHWHYDGYAEYLLYDQAGQKIPIGFKNGFCVLDLGCTTGSSTYNCVNMGISAGCYDEYWAGLECQWVDITDISDGDYILVTRVNWDNAPDALGRVEKDTLNNWAQACITIDRSTGTLTISQDSNCDPYTDCTGTLYGNAEVDCKGICNGLALMGDLDEDLTQSGLDVQGYTEGILSGDLTATPCNDLTDDGVIDIYDLALLSSCLNYGGGHVHPDNGPHDHCNFPFNVVSQDFASLEIIDFDPSSHVDVAIKNESSRVIGYQFTMSGIKISGVENLIEDVEYNHPVMMDPLTNMILSFSQDSQFIERNTAPEALVRIYFSEITLDEICIENIQGIINDDLQTVPNEIVGGCLFITSTHQLNALERIAAFPNPSSGKINVVWNDDQKIFGWEISNLSGQIVSSSTSSGSIDRQLELDLEGNSAGLYFLKIRSEKGMSVLKLILQ